MDQDGDCNFTTAAGFSEPALFLQTDGLGSLTTLINQTRGFFRSSFLAERTTYDAFGSPRFQNPGPDGRADTADDVFSDRSAFNHPYAFTGREWDPESGLYYYRARYYDPKLGRFLQEDPLGLIGGINQYRYVFNNPMRYVDPFGLDAEEILVITKDGVPHTVLAVDDKSSPTSKRYFDFGPGEGINRLKILSGESVQGQVRESTSLDSSNKAVIGTTRKKKQSSEADQQMIEEARNAENDPQKYNLYENNCISFTTDFIE